MESVTRQVQVEQRHIDAGCKLDASNCPLAHAFKDAFPEFDSFCVYGKSVDISYEGWTKCCLLPDSAGAFVTAYDAGKEVSPFTFDFTVTV